jgi:hypothetical protein
MSKAAVKRGRSGGDEEDETVQDLTRLRQKNRAEALKRFEKAVRVPEIGVIQMMQKQVYDAVKEIRSERDERVAHLGVKIDEIWREIGITRVSRQGIIDAVSLSVAAGFLFPTTDDDDETGPVDITEPEKQMPMRPTPTSLGGGGGGGSKAKKPKVEAKKTKRQTTKDKMEKKKLTLPDVVRVYGMMSDADVKDGGVTIDQIHSRSLFTEPPIDHAIVVETIHFLADEGHIYSGITDDHFCSVSPGHPLALSDSALLELTRIGDTKKPKTEAKKKEKKKKQTAKEKKEEEQMFAHDKAKREAEEEKAKRKAASDALQKLADTQAEEEEKEKASHEAAKKEEERALKEMEQNKHLFPDPTDSDMKKKVKARELKTRQEATRDQPRPMQAVAATKKEEEEEKKPKRRFPDRYDDEGLTEDDIHTLSMCKMNENRVRRRFELAKVEFEEAKAMADTARAEIAEKVAARCAKYPPLVV